MHAKGKLSSPSFRLPLLAGSERKLNVQREKCAKSTTLTLSSNEEARKSQQIPSTGRSGSPDAAGKLDGLSINDELL